VSGQLERIRRFLSVRPMLSAGSSRAWAVVNNKGHVLGTVAWLDEWREYTFDPARGSTLSSGCLADIAGFLGRETRNAREARQVSGGSRAARG
jgi:hypothetical protein